MEEVEEPTKEVKEGHHFLPPAARQRPKAHAFLYCSFIVDHKFCCKPVTLGDDAPRLTTARRKMTQMWV